MQVIQLLVQRNVNETMTRRTRSGRPAEREHGGRALFGANPVTADTRQRVGRDVRHECVCGGVVARKEVRHAVRDGGLHTGKGAHGHEVVVGGRNCEGEVQHRERLGWHSTGVRPGS